MSDFNEARLNAAINAAHEELDNVVAEVDRATHQLEVGLRSTKMSAIRIVKTGPECLNAAWTKVLLASWSYNAALAKHVGVKVDRPDIGTFMRLPRLISPTLCATFDLQERAERTLIERRKLFADLEQQLFDQQVELGVLWCELQARQAAAHP